MRRILLAAGLAAVLAAPPQPSADVVRVFPEQLGSFAAAGLRPAGPVRHYRLNGIGLLVEVYRSDERIEVVANQVAAMLRPAASGASGALPLPPALAGMLPVQPERDDRPFRIGSAEEGWMMVGVLAAPSAGDGRGSLVAILNASPDLDGTSVLVSRFDLGALLRAPAEGAGIIAGLPMPPPPGSRLVFSLEGEGSALAVLSGGGTVAEHVQTLAAALRQAGFEVRTTPSRGEPGGRLLAASGQGLQALLHVAEDPSDGEIVSTIQVSPAPGRGPE